MEHFVTCKCQYCNGKIEFDASKAEVSGPHGDLGMGPIVPCPHCSLETVLFVPKNQRNNVQPKVPKVLPIKSAPPVIGPEKEAEQFHISRARVRIFMFIFVGLSVVFIATSIPFYFASDEEASYRQKENAASAKSDSELDLANQAMAEYQKQVSANNYNADNSAYSKYVGDGEADLVDVRFYKEKADNLLNDRNKQANFAFIIAALCAIFWIPCLIYLFLVPATKRDMASAAS